VSGAAFLLLTGTALSAAGPSAAVWVLVLMLVSGFYSGSETALVSARRVRLHRLAAEGRADARTALQLLEDTPRTIATTLVGTNLATVGASSLATAFFVGIAPEHGAALATLTVTPIALFVGEILPKALFRSYATLLLRVLAGTLRASVVLLSPLVALAGGMTRGLLWLLRIPAAESRPLFRREDLTHVFLHAVAMEGVGEGARVGSTMQMARRALDLKDRRVRDAMAELPAEWGMAATATLAEAVERIRAAQPPFLAVEDESGRVQGFVAAKALLGLPPDRPLGELVRPAYVLNPDDPLDDAIGGFRRSQQSVGLVRGRSGRTLGVVTAEDVLEEVVGELGGGPEQSD